MKERVTKEPSSLSPRELARYAVANTAGVSGSPYDEESVEFQRSLYNEHLKNMSKDEYIEYLEQLIREIDFKWVRELAHSTYVSTISLRKEKEPSLEIDQERSVYTGEGPSEIEEKLEALKEYFVWYDCEFYITRYFDAPTVHSLLTRDIWEDRIECKERKT